MEIDKDSYNLKLTRASILGLFDDLSKLHNSFMRYEHVSLGLVYRHLGDLRVKLSEMLEGVDVKV